MMINRIQGVQAIAGKIGACGLALLGVLLPLIAGCQPEQPSGPPAEKTTPPAASFNKTGQRMQAPPPNIQAH